jgi:hypothetical protein
VPAAGQKVDINVFYSIINNIALLYITPSATFAPSQNETSKHEADNRIRHSLLRARKQHDRRPRRSHPVTGLHPARKNGPLQQRTVGELELNFIPNNYFSDVEQAAFAPAHVVDGIGYSPDKMLQGRLLSYPDAQRYRLGANYEQIPVNRCPYATNTYQRDGAMRVDGNGGGAPNYFPNSFSEVRPDPAYKEPGMELEGNYADWYDRNGGRK